MRTLLIADDERTIREGIAGSIRWESHGISRVFLAGNGKEAYDIINKERPDIAIIDIIMPEMTGMEVISCFSDQDKGPEFIIISGHSEFSYAREAMRNKVNNYILKPCDLEEITGAVERIIADLELRRSMEEERSHLRDHLNLLMPQAQEQILRDSLISASPRTIELFHKVFNPCGEEFRLLLISLESTEEFEKLLTLKKCADHLPAIRGWKFSAILHDCVALVLEANPETEIKEAVGQLKKAVSRSPFSGVRVAVSEQGPLDRLPEIYKQTWEAIRFFSPLGSDKRSDEIFFIDASSPQYSRTVQQVIEYVRENLSDSLLSLSHIATNVLYRNPDYLGKLFKKECGIKFSDYLMRVRMEKAKQLIALASDLKIYEVARQVGLGENVAYFGQVFRKYTGMLPSDYRKKHTQGRTEDETNKKAAPYNLLTDAPKWVGPSC